MSSNKNGSNEDPEAPEDDDFGEFDAGEDEAPEAVQAMGAIPTWVYPDLVRVQSTINAYNASQGGNSEANQQARPSSSGTRSGRRLDPPDVSLLTLSAGASTTQNTLDLCSSLNRNSQKLNFTAPSNSSMKNMPSSSCPHTASSPSSSGSSSSSSAITNLSGLILSNSSSTSSTHSVKALERPETASQQTNESSDSSTLVEQTNPVPSTSPYNQRIALLERELRNLQMQKTLLQQQLLQRDTQINELQHSLSSTASNSTLEEAVTQRIDHAFERLQTQLDLSLGQLTERVEKLENQSQNHLVNGSAISALNHHDLSSNIQQAVESVQRGQQETMQVFHNILKYALHELEVHSSKNISKSGNVNGNSG